MRIICGLGNPGTKYENTRHNIGFKVIDNLSSQLGITLEREKFSSSFGEGKTGNEKVLLMKPLTFMNESGKALREVRDFYKLDASDIIVIYDDIDIDLGMIRVRPFGGPGTHNGMRSIVKELGTDRFPRIRLGTGPERDDVDIIDFVLSDFSESETKLIDEVVKTAADAAVCYINDGIDFAMSKFNGKVGNEPEEDE